MPAVEAEVLGVRLRKRTREEAISTILGWLAQDRPRSVLFLHAATANLAFENSAYCAALGRCDLLLNDGIGVRWAARRSGVALPENLVGTDLLPQLLQAATRPLRLYLLGGAPGVAERAAACISSRFPIAQVVGVADGYFAPAEEHRVIEQIRRLAPDLLLVGMGNPRQELFIDRHVPHLGCKVAMGVGGLLDHYAGRLRRAPRWVRRLGLEWLQLLIQQPHKWRRYLLGIPKFLWRVFGVALRRRIAQCLIVGGSLLLAVAAAEAVVRAARPQILERYPEGLYIVSASRQYRMRPHFQGQFRYPEFQTTVRTNSLGLREDREYGPPRPGVRRILALGDSFTMGYSVAQERTWVRRLEAQLGERFEVINAGVPGYSTWQELAYLEEEGLALAPEVVLLGFFLGNDITDNAEPSLPVEVREGQLISTQGRDGILPFGWRLFLARHSHLYHLAWPLQRAWRSGRPAGPPPADAAQVEAGWRATGLLMGRLARICATRGIRPIIVLIPERAHLEARPERDARRLAALCRQAGLDVIDLLDHLRGNGLYFPQDGHWTEDGNAAAARALYQYLRHDTE
jgi:N-acetylglucosaminyldiphosphoundecaprenol N-acetyl-beta-D-mannosaminyltransferase